MFKVGGWGAMQPPAVECGSCEGGITVEHDTGSCFHWKRGKMQIHGIVKVMIQNQEASRKSMKML